MRVIAGRQAGFLCKTQAYTKQAGPLCRNIRIQAGIAAGILPLRRLRKQMVLTIKAFNRPLILAAGFAATVLSGCASARFHDMPQPAAQSAAVPAQVSQRDLPPPDGMAMAEAGAAPLDAADLTPASIAGVWKADLGGMSCQLATPQTKAGKGYRAGSLHCPAALAQIGSWNINGKQLLFYDKSGRDLAVLYSTNANSFAGRTSSGLPVSLSR